MLSGRIVFPQELAFAGGVAAGSVVAAGGSVRVAAAIVAAGSVAAVAAVAVTRNFTKAPRFTKPAPLQASAGAVGSRTASATTAVRRTVRDDMTLNIAAGLVE